MVNRNLNQRNGTDSKKLENAYKLLAEAVTKEFSQEVSASQRDKLDELIAEVSEDNRVQHLAEWDSKRKMIEALRKQDKIEEAIKIGKTHSELIRGGEIGYYAYALIYSNIAVAQLLVGQGRIEEALSLGESISMELEDRLSF